MENYLLDWTRNKYIHGHPLEEIEKYITERYPTLPVGLIILVTRERVLRTLLCAIYYQDKLEQFTAWFSDTDYWPFVPETMPDQDLFRKIIRTGTDSELGKEDKKLRTEDAFRAITLLWQ